MGKKSLIGVIGVLLVIFGISGSILFGLKNEIIGVIISTIFIITGVLLIAWIFGN